MLCCARQDMAVNKKTDVLFKVLIISKNTIETDNDIVHPSFPYPWQFRSRIRVWERAKLQQCVENSRLNVKKELNT